MKQRVREPERRAGDGTFARRVLAPVMILWVVSGFACAAKPRAGIVEMASVRNRVDGHERGAAKATRPRARSNGSRPEPDSSSRARLDRAGRAGAPDHRALGTSGSVEAAVPHATGTMGGAAATGTVDDQPRVPPQRSAPPGTTAELPSAPERKQPGILVVASGVIVLGALIAILARRFL
jgi:hypothetical protein